MDKVEIKSVKDDKYLIEESIIDSKAIDEQKKSNQLLLYFIFFMQGLGTVLPWNVLITASDYFKYSFKDSPYEFNFQNYFSVIFSGFQLLFLIPAIITQNKAFLFKRIFINTLCVSAIFLLLLGLTCVENLSGSIRFLINLIPLISCGIAGVFSITDVYGLASFFPAIYIQAVMSGQAIGGVLVSVFQFLIYYFSLMYKEDSNSVILRGKIYFGVALVITILNLISLLILPKVAIFKYYYQPTSESQSKVNFKLKLNNLLLAFKKVKLLCCSIILVFLVTLSLFPAITSAVVTSNPNADILYKSLFISIHFILFNVGDLIGRLLLGFKKLRLTSDKLIFLLALLRFIFFFLFLTSQLDLGSDYLNSRLIRIFKIDALFFIFVLLFAISSGFLGSNSMILAPSLAINEQQTPLIGNVMSFSLTVGLALGSFLSFALRAIVCQCNSFSQ